MTAAQSDPWTPPPWADIPVIARAALTLLRMTDADPDASRMEAYAAVAAQRIQLYLDCQPGDEPDQPYPDLVEAAVQVTVRLFMGKDAPFGVLGGWTDNTDLGPVRVPADVLQGVYSLIRPFKQRWGMA